MSLKEGRIFIGRLGFKSDVLLSLTEICKKENIKLGVFSVIGAVTSVNLGYYNQNEKRYIDCINLNKKLEISSCMGNISLNNELRDFIRRAGSLPEINAKFRSAKMRYLQEQALREVVAGTTAINEMIRVFSEAKKQTRTRRKPGK